MSPLAITRRTLLGAGVATAAATLTACTAGVSASSGTTTAPVMTTTPGTATAPSGSPTGTLLDELRSGGVSLYQRHCAATTTGTDGADVPAEQQRTLTEEGREQAATIAAALRANGIRTSSVTTSPAVRCTDTADIAYGGGLVDEALQLPGVTDSDPVAHSKDLLARPVPAGQVAVLVGHSTTIAAATGLDAPEAGAVVVRATGGGLTALGLIDLQQWRSWASGS